MSANNYEKFMPNSILSETNNTDTDRDGLKDWDKVNSAEQADFPFGQKKFAPSTTLEAKSVQRHAAGASDGTRTCDLRITNALHYQLCYTSR